MRAYLLVALGGAIGSVLRVATSQALVARVGTFFPYGTLAANLLGAFAIGFVVTLLAPRLPGAAGAYALVVPGILGGYTTFSAFELETLTLLKAGALGRALLYAGGSVLLGLLACWAGARLALMLGAR